MRLSRSAGLDLGGRPTVVCCRIWPGGDLGLLLLWWLRHAVRGKRSSCRWTREEVVVGHGCRWGCAAVKGAGHGCWFPVGCDQGEVRLCEMRERLGLG